MSANCQSLPILGIHSAPVAAARERDRRGFDVRPLSRLGIGESVTRSALAIAVGCKRNQVNKFEGCLAADHHLPIARDHPAGREIGSHELAALRGGRPCLVSRVTECSG